MRKLIRRVYRQKGARRANQISPGEELRIIVKRHRRTLKTLPPDIELWLALFDEAAAFWFAVWGVYREQVEGPDDKRLICLMALAGRVLQDIFCVRELISGGFFVQSNVVSRSLIESIDVMHLLSGRPELANEFHEIKGNVEASQFWHRHCSRDKIHRLIKQRWLWFFNSDEEIASSFHSMRKNYMDLVGMSAHPSFDASLSTFMDSAQNESSNIATNAMGAISHMSKFTMHLVLLRIFEYGLLWSGPEASLYKSEKMSRRKSPLDDNISKGLSAMLSAIKMLGEQRDGDPFYPEFKTYWPRSYFT